MVVNSINFWIFFIIVLVVYFGLFRKSARWQNITLLISSYVFYGMVSWKMCALLLIASAVFYYLGIAISKCNGDNDKKASRLTTLGVLLGVGMLFYFKYLDFFVSQFGELLSAIGLKNNINSFGIVMPLGISFFTFKLIAYVIEVHRETIQPSRDPIAFGTFIAFFPTIMSGPIDQPGKFLPQLDEVRKLDYDGVVDGLKRILWGMFLKMCIADQLSGYTSAVFGNCEHHNATSIILASILYAFQMYTDFAGYSDMAIGVSKVMGIKIAENFNRPIFAQNISEYWRRWHMSLTSWITQYIYMPLNIAFRNLGMAGVCLAAIINTLAIGAWHGANWTYILFGLYHGVIIAIIILVEKRRKKFEKQHGLTKKSWYKYSRMLLTFVLVDFGMVLFQSASLTDFFGTVRALGNGFGMPFFDPMLIYPLLPIILLLVKEWKDENKKSWHLIHSTNSIISVLSMATLITMILLVGNLSGGSFIYFQF
jgi:alginate O-acetyltransferase complex protein AlgI